MKLAFATIITASLTFIMLVLYFSNPFTTPLPSPVSTSNLTVSPPPPTPTLVPQITLGPGSHVFQTFNNCGPAVLSMALSYYGIEASQTTLGDSLRPHQHPKGINDDKSVTLTELAVKANEYNLESYHRPAGTLALLKTALNLKVPVITRTLLKPQNDIGHYRLIKGYNDTTGTLLQDDSLQGKNLQYSYGEFLTLWQPFNYEFLLLVPPSQKNSIETALGPLLPVPNAWQQALNVSNQGLQSNPNDLFAQFNRSVALYHLGQYHDSLQSFELIASQLPPKTLWYQLEPLLAYYQVGRYDQALTVSQSILDQHNPAYSELYQLQGLIYQLQGQPDRSQTLFETAARYNHPNGYWLENLNSL